VTQLFSKTMALGVCAAALSAPSWASPGSRLDAAGMASAEDSELAMPDDARILPVFVDERPDAYVVNGEDAPPGAWPDASSVSGQCTGTLIAPRWVLTAAHCTPGNRFVAVGFVSYAEFQESEYPRENMAAVEVLQEYPHPEYRGYGRDIALLELAEPITSVEPRVIARDCATEEWLDKDTEVAIVGWGATRSNGGGFTDTLQEGYSVVQTPHCSEEWIQSQGQDIYTGCDPSIAPGGEIGAGGNGVDACFGDSGGPLYLNTPSGWYLIGVTSRAYAGVPQSAPCKYGGIYTRPDGVMDWIEETIGRSLERPVCTLLPTADAERIAVKQKKSRTVEITVDDPDGEAYTLEIAEPPAHGTAEINKKGEVVYTAPDDHEGPDPFRVLVVDDGSADWPDNPPGTAEVKVQVDVFKGRAPEALKPYVKGCGCAQGGVGGLAVLPLLGMVALRRRRHA